SHDGPAAPLRGQGGRGPDLGGRGTGLTVSDLKRKDQVGPVLEASEAARAVVSAIRQLNGDAGVEDQGSYLRVLVPHRCVVTPRAIEKALGRPFRLPGDLEIIMPAFKGSLELSEEEAVWSFRESR